MTDYEEGFDLFATAPVRVRKETEEEKRARQLNERREALGLRPVSPPGYYFHWAEMVKWVDDMLDRSLVWGSAFPKYEFKGLDLGVKDISSFRWIIFDEATDLPDWRWDTPWHTPTPVLVPLPKYQASTAVIKPVEVINKSIYQIHSQPEPAWLKLRGKYDRHQS